MDSAPATLRTKSVNKREVRTIAVVEYWIQLEVRDWDTQPQNIDRMDTTMGVTPDVITAAGDPLDLASGSILMMPMVQGWAAGK